jgi:hypothetical protein
MGAHDVEQHPAITAGAKGRIDIDATGAGSELVDRFAAKNRDMAPGNIAIAGPSHAPAPRAIGGMQKKWDANGSIAPQMPAVCCAFPRKKPQPDRFTFFPHPDSGGPCPQTRLSAWNLMGCHEIRAGISSVKRASAVPKPDRRFTT